MGPQRVVEILKDLREDYQGKLIIQEPDDPKKSLRATLQNSDSAGNKG